MDLSPSSPVSASSSSTFPGESLDSSNQVAKKKKKKTKKKKSDKREAKAATTASEAPPLDKPSNPPQYLSDWLLLHSNSALSRFEPRLHGSFESLGFIFDLKDFFVNLRSDCVFAIQ